jgi:hypothetical protein
MDNVLSTQVNFRALSLKDLLEARDLYHYQLMNRPNVVGTAVGLYLIRKSDPLHATVDAAAARVLTPKGERTLGNSEVRDYSWPCVLAFVKEWVFADKFTYAGEFRAENLLPRTLYMPDGRMVPVCVVKVDPGSTDDQQLIPDWHWPKNLYAPGMPIVVEAQGAERRASVGCLVSDGHTVFALTNRHVTGNTGERIFTLARGRRVPIGSATRRCISRMPFEKAYPEFPGRRTFINIDVGLVAVDRVDDWTSAVLGLGPTEGMADLNQLNITTRLIDAPLVAAGAASGRMVGRIKALFYRYKSVGGYDYVADFLIAPQANEHAPKDRNVDVVQTHRGDSGTVWHLVTRRETSVESDDRRVSNSFEGDLHPLAVEWGGQVLTQNTGGERFTFALATSLTTVCRSLDVELITEHNLGAQPFWGQTGHYTIANFAIDALDVGKLKSFLAKNVDKITFTTEDLTPSVISERLKAAKATIKEGGDAFVPLADVPDVVWKTFKTNPGGRDDRSSGHGTTGPEHPTHFADIDEPSTTNDSSSTLRALSLADPKNNLTVEFWRQFYTDLGHTTFDKRGLLPFRVWQFFDAMSRFARNRDAVGFLCAAGIVAHYVGDACQPLHGSMFADGFADRVTSKDVHKRDGTVEKQKTHVGEGVHSTYESAMIDRKSADLLTALEKLRGKKGPVLDIQKDKANGKGAALEVVRLMDRTAEAIDPTTLINAYVKAGGKNTNPVKDALFAQFGAATVGVMADGGRTLAAIWQAAWDAGEGDAIDQPDLDDVDPSALLKLYNDPAFVPSLNLDDIGPVLTKGAASNKATPKRTLAKKNVRKKPRR